MVNILNNPGFEEGTAYWSLGLEGDVAADFSITTDAYSGLNAGQLTVTRWTTVQPRWAVLIQNLMGKLQAGKKYRLGAWFKHNMPGAGIVIYAQDINGATIWKAAVNFYASATYQYVEIVTTTVPPEIQNATYVAVHIEGWGLGTLLIDDVIIEEVAPPPPPPGPCFIATVAYGSPLAYELHMLRSFRDQCLPNSIVNVYYGVGPYLAQLIKTRETTKRYVREVFNLLVKLLKK